MMLPPTLTPLLSRTTRNTWTTVEGGRHSSQTLTSVTRMQVTKQSALGMCGTVAWINWEGGDICVQIQDYIVASTLPLHVVPQNVCTVLSKYFILFQISESSAIFKSLFLMFYKKLLMRYRYKQEHRNGFRCYEVITLQCLLGCGTSESSNCLL